MIKFIYKKKLFYVNMVTTYNFESFTCLACTSHLSHWVHPHDFPYHDFNIANSANIMKFNF